ncbi:unnamed protein product [Protopolystoma xenopodis]|uniref:DNA topoisomerase 3-beta zinc ribbon domain-containing protein n=1 Tax=Protopolystoma xenopodis TaxID=117903 RepID=A0A448XFX5_9PLAT|nr:unnamed protein product [Protopolystoma xenopodis]
MKLIESRPQRLHCPQCNQTYSLPQNGSIRQHKQDKCPLDEFELLVWTQGSKSKALKSNGFQCNTELLENLVFCPYCFSNPPFESMHCGSGCFSCAHPSCEHSPAARGVTACLECKVGIMLLDDTIPPKFRFVCNRQSKHRLV